MKKLTFYLSFLFLFGFSIFCWLIVLGDVKDPIVIAQYLDWLYTGIQGKLIIAACGFITIGCAFSLLLSSFSFDAEPKTIIVQENESGTIGISQNAIEQFVIRTAKNMHGVNDISIRTEEIGNQLSIRVKLILTLERKIPEFIRDFQETIHRELTETLGLNNLRDIQVVIQKVIPQETIVTPYAKEEKTQVVLKDIPKETTID